MKYSEDIARLQEARLDAMIKLAFDLDDAETTRRLLESPDPDLTPDEERLADEILTLALSRAEKEQKRSRQHDFARTARKVLPFVINTAACIILLLAMATPIALANSATFRSKVMQLLVEFDHEKGEAYFSFVPDNSTGFDVPDRWMGSYFPSYIPEGFTIYDWDPDFGEPTIEYRNEQQDQVFFHEMDEDWDMMTGTENSTISYVDINGSTGVLITGPAIDDITWAVTIIWQNDANWFHIVTFGLSTDEALQVARSVRRIVK